MKRFLLYFIFLFNASFALSQIKISIPTNYVGLNGTDIDIPVFIDNLTGKKVYSYDIRVTYNSTVLTALGFDAVNTISSGMLVLSNTDNPGEMKIAAASSTPMAGGGILIKLRFRVIGTSGRYTSISFVSATLNSGSPNTQLYNGSFWVVSTTGGLWAIPQEPASMDSYGRIVAYLPAAGGSTKIYVSNLGFGSLIWSATSSSTGNWLPSPIPSTGVNSGTMILTYPANTSSSERNGSIIVTANTSSTPSQRVIYFIQYGSSPGPPSLTSPIDNDTVAVNPSFAWGSVAGASSYSLQVSNSLIDWSNPIINISGITGNSYISTITLENSKRYYWRMSASNVSGTSSWSMAKSFVTVIPKPGVPIPLYPGNNSYGITDIPVFIWSQVESAVSYDFQLSTSDNFTSLVKDTNTAILSYSIFSSAPLVNSTRYYWRIRAKNIGGVSDWSPVQNFKTILARPALQSPSNGYLGQPVQPTLSWYSVNEATAYHVQVSDTLEWITPKVWVTNLTATSYKLTTTLDGLKTYYWRVRAQNEEGIGDWSAYRSFRTQMSMPSAPLLVSPVNNASCVPVPQNIFIWKKDTNASNYNLQVSKSLTLWDSANLVVDQKNLTVYYYTATKLSGSQTYYWRVRSTNSVGTGPWSNPYGFTTSLAAPEAVTPKDSSVGNSIMPVLSWKITPNATSYSIQISSNYNDWTNPVLEQNNITVAFFNVPDKILSNNVTYYWRIKAANAYCSGNWSGIYRFKTILAAPKLVSPVETVTPIPLNPALKWTKVAGAISYNLQISTDQVFSSLVKNQSYSDTVATITGLNNSTIYYWRVNATDGKNPSAWSDYWRFTTIELLPGAPALSQPLNGEKGISLNPYLKWNPLSGLTTYYKVQLSTDPNFNTNVIEQADLTASSFKTHTLSNNTVYYWKVQARNSGGTGPWSNYWSFTTVGRPANIIKVSGDNQTCEAGGILLNPLIIKVTDAENYPVSDVNVKFKYTKIPEGATGQMLSPADSRTNEIGESSTLVGIGNKMGTYEISVTAGDFPNNTIVFTLSAIAGSPAKLILVSGDNQIGEVNSQLPIPLTIKITDIEDNPVENMDINFLIDEMPANSYGQKLSVIDTVTDKNGMASSVLTLGDIPGIYKTFVTCGQLYEGITLTSKAVIPTYPITYTINTKIASFPLYSKTSDYQNSEYKLIGLPGASNVLISKFLPGNAGDDWQVYWDNGSSKNYMIKYDGGSRFIDSIGKAFWLIKKGDWELQTVIPTAPLNSAEEVEIPLRSGWNLITNPFTEPISWQRIQEVNNTKNPLFTFKGVWDTASIFAPFNGYYYDNTSKLKILKIPYYLLFQRHPSTYFKGFSYFNTGIKLKSENSSGGDVYFGLSCSEEIHFRKPGTYNDDNAIYFYNPNQQDGNQSLMVDIKLSNGDLKTWELITITKPGIIHSLVFYGLTNIPAEQNIKLYFESGSKLFDLRKDSIISFKPETKINKFIILVGSNERIEKKVCDLLIPSDFKLGQCFPNPFNPSTIIPVNIPRNSKISLKVFDILGREIKTIFSGEILRGEYNFEWDGRDYNGKTLPSGAYISRLVTESGLTLSNKMLLMK